ncbi:EC1118_1G1_0584p [Saccharomyces cerevisiae EC1118]|uniref:Putative uncharacterized protein YGL214W n=2 Tax=Saccharomyces cerevisiae TaxID=4932 RepID=YGW4_YEAST|nr:RecName: Full=Putative uncharacterized protein YGL214W [Saccharomyces cerevisiae S288C]CAY79557.1 EC1118_1G1_0584p [Saccharomyces cerevisiae EC1118]
MIVRLHAIYQDITRDYLPPASLNHLMLLSKQTQHKLSFKSAPIPDLQPFFKNFTSKTPGSAKESPCSSTAKISSSISISSQCIFNVVILSFVFTSQNLNLPSHPALHNVSPESLNDRLMTQLECANSPRLACELWVGTDKEPILSPNSVSYRVMQPNEFES